jgi:germination protein, Ger(x)C family
MFGIDNGVSDKWRVTVQFRSISRGTSSSTGQSGGGGSESGFSYQTETVDAPSFFAAVNIINTNIPRRLNFEHAKLIALSEDIARSGIVGEFIAPLVRYREIRRTTNLVVTEGTAEDFVQSFKPFIGSTVTKTIEDLMSESRETGYFPKISLDEFYSDIKSTSEQAVAALGAVNNSQYFKENGQKYDGKFNVSGNYIAGEVPRKEGNKIELFGSAIFNGDTMVGKLTGYETRMMQILTGKFYKAVITVQDPKASQFDVPIETRQPQKPKVRIKFANGKPIVNVDINLIGDILAIESRVDYENVKLKPILEQAVENYIKEGIEKTIEKCKELNCDVFNFGTVAVRHFGTIEEWESYNWNNHFKDAQVKVNIKYIIRRAGSMLKNMPIRSAEGKE